MASIIDNIKAGFARGTLLVRLIYLNVAVFLLVHLVAVILTLWNIHPTAWMAYIDLPSDIGELLHRPWTLLTYMYVHYDVWHSNTSPPSRWEASISSAVWQEPCSM